MSNDAPDSELLTSRNIFDEMNVASDGGDCDNRSDNETKHHSAGSSWISSKKIIQDLHLFGLI